MKLGIYGINDHRTLEARDFLLTFCSKFCEQFLQRVLKNLSIRPSRFSDNSIFAGGTTNKKHMPHSWASKYIVAYPMTFSHPMLFVGDLSEVTSTNGLLKVLDWYYSVYKAKRSNMWTIWQGVTIITDIISKYRVLSLPYQNTFYQYLQELFFHRTDIPQAPPKLSMS